MKVTTAIVEEGFVSSLLFRLEDFDEGIFLASENSMVDVHSIEKYGSIEKYSIDLDSLEGNLAIKFCLKKIIEDSEEKEGIYFPGTLLEKRQGYSVVTMPVISEGKIIGRRRKLTSLPYIYNWENILKSYNIETQNKRGILLFEEPFSTIYKEICLEKDKEAINSIKSFEKESHRILPIICNEIGLIPKHYKGKPVSVILHSCTNLFNSLESREKFYHKLIPHLNSLVEEEYFIIFCENGRFPSQGIYKVKDNSLKRYNQKII